MDVGVQGGRVHTIGGKMAGDLPPQLGQDVEPAEINIGL